MEFIQELNLIYCCYTLYILLYGIFIVAVEATSFGQGICLITIPLIMYCAFKIIAIPKPSKSEIKEVLGVDIWRQFKERNTDEINADLRDFDDGNGDLTFKTIAHRGAGLDAPENSISAVKACKEKGCKFVEIDLSLTRDGVPIVFHDATLDRMVGVSGNVQDFLWDELKNYDLIFQPCKDKKAFNGEKIALFDEYIDLCVELGVRIFIDIKDRRDEVVNIILQTYKRHPDLCKTSLVTSFNPFIIYKIRRSNPKIVCSMAWRPYYFSQKTYNPFQRVEKRYSSIFMHSGAVIFDIISTWLFNNIIYYIVGLSAVLIHKDAVSSSSLNSMRK
ncbi:glycerophosphodiester phosphodiesterase 1 isoform X2 [Lycorma delicatula]|uniref:glycerophosphodiester phosphodiesterase 1 isoform X2 n=1 Tax=Lycorma delicatula TaxID=130591 RepID=UPI003F513632